jgi:hypothetical protein
MSGRSRLTFSWRAQTLDVVEIPELDGVHNSAFVSIRAPGWSPRDPRAAHDEIVIVDENGASYLLDVEGVDGRGDSLTLNGYVHRARR